jgi:hypothetical protein
MFCRLRLRLNASRLSPCALNGRWMRFAPALPVALFAIAFNLSLTESAEIISVGMESDVACARSQQQPPGMVAPDVSLQEVA